MICNMVMVGDSHRCVVEYTQKVQTHLLNLDNKDFCFYQTLRIDVHTSTLYKYKFHICKTKIGYTKRIPQGDDLVVCYGFCLVPQRSQVKTCW